MADDETGTPSYTRWTNTTFMYDGDNALVGRWPAVEELFLDQERYVIRYHREEGPRAEYEDRGTIGPTGTISGDTGFGGRLGGQVIGDEKGVYLTGTGGDCDVTVMTPVISPERAICARRFSVNRPTTIFGQPVEPGVYWTTSTDVLQAGAVEMPDDLRRPLPHGNVAG